jgi:acyl-CoA oxidase
VIHSPTITSTKFWPGDLGRFSTHAIVFARCLAAGKDYGVQPFMVQLRDVASFKHCKGVTSGDLGPKFGYTSKDNGWARFNQVRIPRTDMLMGIASVDKAGKF